jgi:peptidoglycan hydrolase-like protein with peptidoglycan-binding domain
MKHTPLTLTTLTIITALALTASGCGKKAETTALNTTSDLEILASLGEGAGSAQNTVEIIPVPQSQAAFGNSMDSAQTMMQQGIQQAGQIAAVLPADIKPGTVEFSKKVQSALKSAGLYTGNVDGKIGPKTREAIKTFQSQNGLKADGVAGAQTWAKLAQYYTSSAPAPAAVSSTAE